MNPHERAVAALKRLISTYGVNMIAARCINPNTNAPLSRQAVEKWDVIPLIHAKALAELDKCEVRQLRPDIWDLLK